MLFLHSSLLFCDLSILTIRTCSSASLRTADFWVRWIGRPSDCGAVLLALPIQTRSWFHDDNLMLHESSKGNKMWPDLTKGGTLCKMRIFGPFQSSTISRQQEPWLSWFVSNSGLVLHKYVRRVPGLWGRASKWAIKQLSTSIDAAAHHTYPRSGRSSKFFARIAQ